MRVGRVSEQLVHACKVIFTNDSCASCIVVGYSSSGLNITVFHCLVRTSSLFIFSPSLFPPLLSSSSFLPSVHPFFYPIFPSLLSLLQTSSPLPTSSLGWVPPWRVFLDDICQLHCHPRQSLWSQCLNQVLKGEQPDVDTKSSNLLNLQGNTSADLDCFLNIWFPWYSVVCQSYWRSKVTWSQWVCEN